MSTSKMSTTTATPTKPTPNTTDDGIDWTNRLNNYRTHMAGKRLSVAGHHHQSYALGGTSQAAAAAAAAHHSNGGVGPGGSRLPSSTIIDDVDEYDDLSEEEEGTSFTTSVSTHISDEPSTSRSGVPPAPPTTTTGGGPTSITSHRYSTSNMQSTSRSTAAAAATGRAGGASGDISAAHHPPTTHHGREDDEQVNEDDLQQWVELTSPYDHQYRLYYNRVTKETTFVRPDDYTPPDDDDDDDDDGEDNGELRNASTVGGGSTTTTSTHGHSRPHRAAGRYRDTEDDDEDVGNSQSSSLARVLHHLKVAAVNIDRTLTHLTPSSTTSSETAQQVYQAIISLKNDLMKTKKLVHDASGGAVGVVSGIDSLIGWDRHRWNFTPSKAIRAYRAASTLTNHQAILYTQWNMPQYFSVQPLLPSSTKVRVQVSIGKVTGDTAGSSTTTTPVLAAGGVPGNKRTTLEATLGELTSSVIIKALQKLVPTRILDTVNPADYVLKVVGHHEYFDHPYVFFDYQYVRKAIRDFHDIDAVLVPRPSLELDAEQRNKCNERQQQYQSKIDHNVLPLTKTTYRDLVDLSFLSIDELNQVTHIPMASVCIPFSVEVVGLDNLTREAFPRFTSDITSIYVKATLFHGCTSLPFNHDTSAVDLTTTVHFREMLYGNWMTQIATLPRETRIAYVVMGRSERGKQEDVALGWVVAQLVDVSGELLRGQVDHTMWSLAAVEGKKHGKKRDTDPHYLYRAPPYDNLALGVQKVLLRVRYPEFSHPVVAPLVHAYAEPVVSLVGAPIDKRLDPAQGEILVKALHDVSAVPLTLEIKQLLWNCRHYLVDVPSALPKFLQSVNWSSQDARNEAHRLLKMWAVPENKIDAIELLDARFADYTVREYAVDVLRMLTDDQLQLFCLQLVQCLKFECYHDSPLSRFLIERSLASPWVIGHAVFWHLKAEVHDPYVCERFSLILEELLSHSSVMVDELHKQYEVVRALQAVAEKIVQMRHEYRSTEEEMQTEYKKMLHQLNRDLFTRIGKFKAPLNPHQDATTLMIDKCRYMSSKMVPLWLVFNNADEDGPPIIFIFKSGDDLRQDFLTLQLLRVMDQLWLQRGLDMRLKPYNVIATGINKIGEGVGMIEVVLGSDTTSGIQVKYGGGATGAFKVEPLDLYIREHNNDAQSYMRAVDNFVRSCAGYCVATFVLGVGDRHNGNIMLTKAGHLFHIDFGHFLGNFKTKFGFKRERAAFVFTPDMAYLMGGKDFKKSPLFSDFKKLCSRSFNVLRNNARLLQNLFELMIVAQMPQLLQESDIDYLRDQLYLQLAPKQAASKYHSELMRALLSTSRRFDNYVHNVIHSNK